MSTAFRTNSHQRAAMAKTVLTEEMYNIERYFGASVYMDLYKLIAQLGDPVKSNSQVDDGIKQIHFRNKFTVTFFAWGGNNPQSVFDSEDSFKSDYLSPEVASTYLENTNMHDFYAKCLEFQTQHKHTSIFANAATELNSIPLPHERWICLSYIGRIYNVCITQRVK